MTEITVGADHVAGCFYELFKAKPWLISAKTMTPDDAPAESEAVAFLLQLARYDAKCWGQTSPAGQRVAVSLLLDFMAKLMHPDSPLHGLSWTIPAGRPAWQQALHVLEHEIQKAHGHRPVQH